MKMFSKGLLMVGVIICSLLTLQSRSANAFSLTFPVSGSISGNPDDITFGQVNGTFFGKITLDPKASDLTPSAPEALYNLLAYELAVELWSQQGSGSTTWFPVRSPGSDAVNFGTLQVAVPRSGQLLGNSYFVLQVGALQPPVTNDPFNPIGSGGVYGEYGKQLTLAWELSASTLSNPKNLFCSSSNYFGCISGKDWFTNNLHTSNSWGQYQDTLAGSFLRGTYQATGSASAVPEPTTVLGMLTATGLGAIIKRRQLKRV